VHIRPVPCTSPAVCTSSLGAGLADVDGTGPPLPGPDPRLLAKWEHMGDERGPEEELAWRVEHWRILNGGTVPFEEDEFRALEEGSRRTAGRSRPRSRTRRPTSPGWSAIPRRSPR
jgi:hypothetical protein